MHINEQYHDLSLLKNVKHQFIGRDGEIFDETEPVLIEHLLDVYVNDRLTMKLICIPEYLTELVLGRLLTEGIIRTVDEIEQIYVCEFGRRIRVMLKNPADCRTVKNPLSADSGNYVESTLSCCTGNHILNDYFLTHTEIYPVTPIFWKTSWIFDLADRFSKGMPLHSQTWATHSCFLASEGKLLFQCEDIGRHNALDKVIGHALRHHIDLTKCIVYSSGRIPTDMAVKAIRAGIPILASKAAPSAEAVRLAQEYQLTLICAARRDRMKQFCGPAPVDRFPDAAQERN